WPRLAFRGHLMLFHGLQQRALCFGRGAVHFVREYHMRENGAGVESERACVAVEDGYAQYVRGQQVAGELDALKLQAQRDGQRVRHGGLAYPGYVFYQQVAARQHAGDREAYLAFLAEYDFADLANDIIELLTHFCGDCSLECVRGKV